MKQRKDHPGAHESTQHLLQAHPAELVFVPIDACLDELYYGDPLVRQRLRCVYSAQRELRYAGTLQVALTSQALSTLPGFHVMTYEQMMSTPGQRMIVALPSRWNRWFLAALHADNTTLTPLGNGITGDIFSVAPKTGPVHEGKSD